MKRIWNGRGGGIRQILEASCVKEAEAQLGGLLRDHIDYVSGTSAGGMNAAAIAAGLPGTEILRVFTKRTDEIFTPTGIEADAKRAVDGYMFDPKNANKVLMSELGKEADWTMNDCPIDILICATEMNGHNWSFVRDNPRNNQLTGKVRLVDAAIASSCAPTYFNYWPVEIGGKTKLFFDGGSGGLANPVYEVCLQAFLLNTYDPKDTRVTSIASGYYPGLSVPPKGLLGNIGWVTSTLVDTSEDWMDAATHLQWPGVMQSINIELPSDIDEADLTAIPALVEVGKRMADRDWKTVLGL